MPTLSRPEDVRRQWTSSVCYYSNKCTVIHVDAQNSGANAASKHKAAAQMRELCEGALGAAYTGRWQGITGGAVYRRDDSRRPAQNRGGRVSVPPVG
jgi:predicted Ser/Thr protein kinase